MEQVDRWVQWVAVAAGVVAILAPLVAALRQARRPAGRATGKAAGLRSWPFMLLMTAGLTALGFLLWKPVFPGFSSRLRGLLSLVGAFPYFAGVGVYLWGLVTLGRQFGVSSAFGAGLYREHHLVTSGPFALVRHPMYTGVLLAGLGALLIFRTWAMLLFTPLCMTVIARAQREEELLRQAFGEAWTTYAVRVPKWLPRL